MSPLAPLHTVLAILQQSARCMHLTTQIPNLTSPWHFHTTTSCDGSHQACIAAWLILRHAYHVCPLSQHVDSILGYAVSV